jgi:endonuclease-8
MPEGDTIHRTAATLRAVLGQGPLTRFEVVPGRIRGSSPVPGSGELIGPIEARGKHLLIGFSGGTTFHTHLRMNGAWHTYRRGQHWRRPRRTLVAALATEHAQAVCFEAPTAELLSADDLRRHPHLHTLGPDLCLPDPDLDEALRRLSEVEGARTSIGVVLLDQRIAAGVGNIYRSEVLWACRVDPATPLADVDMSTRRRLLSTAARLLRENLDRYPRRTISSGLAVYERSGLPCPRCDARIRVRRMGDGARSVFWCPACQTSGPWD